MQPAAQAGLIAGGALATYLMAKITSTQHPTPSSTESEIIEISIPTDSPITNSPVAVELGIEPDVPYIPWNISVAKGADYDLLQSVAEQTLSTSLLHSTDAAKLKALQIGQFGFPSCGNLRFFDSFCASLNYRTHIPNWSGECISNEDLAVNEEVDRQKCPSFFEEESVAEKYKSLLTDYKRSGYSRGHLAPAGDYQNIQKHKDLTFNLNANVVPQELSMNGCDWLRLERFVKQLIVSPDNDVKRCWIFSGPVFKPRIKVWRNGDKMYSQPMMVPKEKKDAEGTESESADSTESGKEMVEVIKVYNEPVSDGRYKGKMQYKTIGASMVHVPTHMFKVVLAESGNRSTDGDLKKEEELTSSDQSSYHLAAFMMQNEPIPQKLPITDYLVDIEELEQFVGLQFFPKLRAGVDGREVAEYADLCAKYKCVYDDDDRSSGWRFFGQIKGATNLDELQNAFDGAVERGFDASWMESMHRREYKFKKKDLVRALQHRIDRMRLYQ